MWIHEGFTCYSESLFTEYWYGKEAGEDYVIGLRKNILNKEPIIGDYGVNNEGSSDMYYKGANLLHTIRTLINNDQKWRAILMGLNATFGKKTTNTLSIINYINKQSGFDFTKIFDQYLRFAALPVLELRQESGKIACRWQAEVKNFDMPIQFEGNDKFFYPNSEWKILPIAKPLNSVKLNKDYFVTVNIIGD
jgi:aminopeptidase N